MKMKTQGLIAVTALLFLSGSTTKGKYNNK